MHRTIWWSAFLAFSMACISVWGYAVYRDRESTLAHAQLRLEGVALLLEEHADRAFEAGETMAQALVEVAEDVSLDDPETLERIFRQIGRLKGQSPQISSAWIMDADGVTRVETWAHPPRTEGSYAHRRYFQAHVDGEAGLFIGELQIGVRSGRPRFTLSRRLNRDDGGFAGVAAVGVYRDYFVELYGQAALGEGDRFRLITSKGDLLAEWSAQVETDTAPGDVVEVVRPLERYPVQVAVAQPVSVILAPWRLHVLQMGAVALAAIAAFGGITALGLKTAAKERQLRRALSDANRNLERRIEERTAELRRSEGRLAAALQCLPVGVGIIEADGRVSLGNAEFLRLVRDLIPSRDPASAGRWRAFDPDGKPLPSTEFPGARALRGETVVPGIDFLHRDAEGREIWVRVSAAPLSGGDLAGSRAVIALQDIDEMKHASVELAARHKELQSLYDTAPVGLCMFDREMRFVRVNRRLAAMHGRPAEDHVGRTIQEVVPDLYEQVEPLFRRVVEHGEVVFDHEVMGHTPDRPGTTRFWLENWTPFFDEKGSLLGVNVSVEETTEKRRAEHELRIAHARLRSLFATVGAGTFIWQLPDGKIEGDAGLARLYGLSDEEAIWSRPEDFYGCHHPDDMPRVRAKVEELLANGGTRYDEEFRVILPDGTIRWCLARGTVDGNRLFSGAVFDVTDLKTAQEAARASEKRLRLVADSAPALISYVGGDGRYRFVNHAYEQWFGLSRGAIEGHSVRELVGEGAYEVLRPRLEAAFRGEPVKFESLLPYKSGGARHVQVDYIPNITPSGAVDGFFAFIVDVTQRKKDEEALLDAKAKVESLAAERSAILDQLSEGVIVTDPIGTIIFMNDAAARIHGREPVPVGPEGYTKAYDLLTVEGEPFPDEDLPLTRAVRNGEIVTEQRWRIRRPDGREVLAIGNARPVYKGDGTLLGGVLTLRDDTERHAAEEALALSERRLSAVLDNTKMAVFMMDDRQHCIYMNAAAEELTGFSFEETQDRPLHEVVHLKTQGGQPVPLSLRFDPAVARDSQTEGEDVLVRKDGGRVAVAFTASPIRGKAAKVVGTIVELRDITLEKEHEERLNLLIDELNHRVKNTLATVQAIAWQALRGEDVPRRVRDAIESRLLALSRSHDLLTRESWVTAGLRDVVYESLEPFGILGGRSGRFIVEGENIRIKPKMALAFGMALHELATNAVKYGALSNDDGQVELRWHASGDRLRFFWRETGGPAVSPPVRKGFGSRLLERGLAHEVKGDVSLAYPPEGFRCTIEFHVPDLRGEEI